MAKVKITIPSEGFETTATLLQNEAPKTCKAILDILPFEGSLTHAMMSGNEVLTMIPEERKLRLEPENWVFKVLPGDVVFFYSYWGEGRYLKDNDEFFEFAFIYGRHAQLRDLSFRESAGNLWATLDGKLEEFATICRKIRLEGGRKILIQEL